MKILFLADSNSPHTIRWVKSISKHSINVALFSFYKPDHNWYDNADLTIYSLDLPRNMQMKQSDDLSKSKYLKAVREVKKIIKIFKPDILHSHYASSYGLIGALTGFHPYIISVWGADIYYFPNYSFIHRGIIKYNLSKADKILSTSNVMRGEIQRYTNKEVIVTPFGINVDRFFPQKVKRLFDDGDIVIGTVKALEKKYGVEILIKGFEIVKKKFPDKPLKLLIVGKGSQEKYLKELVQNLKLENDTIFTGYVNPEEIQNYHNIIDISVFPSIDSSESFGVSVLEASACSKPVIVSKIGGLSEVVENEKTGFIIEPENITELAFAISKLIADARLRAELGENGRNKVLQDYNWNDCVNQMISIYEDILQ